MLYRVGFWDSWILEVILDKKIVRKKTKTCDTHGPYEATEWELPGGVVICSPCPVCSELLLKEEQLEKDKKAAFQHGLNLSLAGIGKRYIEASFSNFIVSRPEEGEAMGQCREYAEKFSRKKSPNLVMYGDTGTGKTHLASAISAELLHKGFTVKYLPILKLFSQYQDIRGYSGEISREEFFLNLAAPDLLVIDEFGIVSLQDSERNVLHRVIDDRYCNKAPIAIIGNISLSILEKEVGERAFRRVLGEALVIECAWSKDPDTIDMFGDSEEKPSEGV